jgi:flavin-dependent dehydrogenase
VKRYDIAIIGGGPAGATLAALMAGAGWSVAVVERAEFPRRKVCGEFLSATTIPILARLGLADAFLDAAGPEIRRVGFFAGDGALAAAMPAARGAPAWGRALGRESLDTMLLRRAAALGADVLQPWAVTALDRAGNEWHLHLRAAVSREQAVIAAPLVAAAHGSWESGELPSQPGRRAARAGDLFGFKAHFRNTSLPPDLMPLLVFPGGYGGMVSVDGGRASLSCCVRRDRLEALRRRHPESRAGEAVLQHIVGTTKGVREALQGARVDGAILAAGPIRPGIRARAREGIFRLGNAAGEAHPIVAEGIGMAMQSALILSGCLEREREAFGSDARAAAIARAERDYSRRWRGAFAPRILASAGIANLAVRAPLAAIMRGVIGLWPQVLTAGAYFAGKTKFV